MTHLDRLTIIVLALVGSAGCGDFSERADAGAADEPICFEVPLHEVWPIESTTAGGSIEIGVDRSGFAPLPDELTFILGMGQGTPGVLLPLQARMVGLEPGGEFGDPRNPRVRFWGTFADGTVYGRECPSRVGFVPSDEEGAFERHTFMPLEFVPLADAARGFDTVVKLKVEVIDAEGRYASDEREVFCRAPAGWYADAGPADGGPADAGPAADGGAADASPESDAAM